MLKGGYETGCLMYWVMREVEEMRRTGRPKCKDIRDLKWEQIIRLAADNGLYSPLL